MTSNWDKTREALLAGLTPAKEEIVRRFLDNHRKLLMEEFAPQIDFNAARKYRIQQIRIKRKLVNISRKERGLKPYRPKISVFPKVKTIGHPLPIIRRIIPGTICFDGSASYGKRLTLDYQTAK